MADDWLDDSSGDPEAQESARRQILSNDFRKASEARFKTAYRESLQDAREDEQCLQAGFDAGYHDAAMAAKVRGRARGCLQLLIALADSGKLRLERSAARDGVVPLAAPAAVDDRAPVGTRDSDAVAVGRAQELSTRQQLLDMATRLSQLRWPQQEVLRECEADGVLRQAGLIRPVHGAGSDAAARQGDAGPHSSPAGVQSAASGLHVSSGSSARDGWRPFAAAKAAPHLEQLCTDVRQAEALVQEVLGEVITVLSAPDSVSPAVIEAIKEEIRQAAGEAEGLCLSAARSAS